MPVASTLRYCFPVAAFPKTPAPEFLLDPPPGVYTVIAFGLALYLDCTDR